MLNKALFIKCYIQEDCTAIKMITQLFRSTFEDILFVLFILFYKLQLSCIAVKELNLLLFFSVLFNMAFSIPCISNYVTGVTCPLQI